MVWMCKHSRRSGRFRRMSQKAIDATNDHNIISRQFSNTDRFLMTWFYDWSDDEDEVCETCDKTLKPGEGKSQLTGSLSCVVCPDCYEEERATE